MDPRCVLLLSVAGCGEVLGIGDLRGPVDAGIGDALVPGSYEGGLMQTSPQLFGGMPFCNYTITLEQLDITLGVVANGEVTSGHVQAYNVETILNPSVPECPAGSETPPNLATYMLQLPANGTHLTFVGADGNQPHADLVVELMLDNQPPLAQLDFHRSDQMPPLDWIVTVTVPLLLQM